jgi:subtilisin family serine protease
MRRLLIASILACTAHADPVRVAVIDTGFDMTWAEKPNDVRLKQPLDGIALGTVPSKICKDGLYDFVSGKGDGQVTEKDMTDGHGHGTHIAGLIAKYALSADYCLVIMKYYDAKGNDLLNLVNTVVALKTAIRLKVDVINYSGGGIAPSPEEREQIEAALDAGIIVVAAAGNERSDINVRKFYPASYDPRIVVVGSTDRWDNKVPSSNWSDNKPKEIRVEKERGDDVFSTLPGGQYGYMSGTSQATAVMTGSIVNRLAMMRKDTYFKIINDRKMPLKDVPHSCSARKDNNAESTFPRISCIREPSR